MDVDRIEFLLLQPRLVGVLAAGATRRDDPGGHGGGLSARCCMYCRDLKDTIPLGDEGKAGESIVPFPREIFSGDRSGDDIFLGKPPLLPRVRDGRAPLKLLERNCIGNGDDNDAEGLVFVSGVVGRCSVNRSGVVVASASFFFSIDSLSC